MVIRAFMISTGLYLVVWDKSKDHKLQDLLQDNEKEVNSDQMIEASRINDEEYHKVLSVANKKEVEYEQMIEASRSTMMKITSCLVVTIARDSIGHNTNGIQNGAEDKNS
ncbi:hypothetical protein POM88_013612 [Heracleum sosnowskyi]|uniref:Uncharacterized protein n=1 Tax=Heracleum sosnowskyi TaxID=360622 RepID=A0AAD8J1E4_9APIA|nr:hypothetical protein POM88_013612 [Heracleum sosnowskyi]